MQKKVLIVEKNAANQILMRNRLPHSLVEGHCAENGFQAINKLREASLLGRPFDLIIFGETLEDMDGLHLAKVIKSEPKIQNIKLILLTSANPPNEKEIMAAGIFRCLSKPVDRARLHGCLEIKNDSNTISGAVSASSLFVGAAKPTTAPCGKGPHVLLAEDNRVDREFALAMLDCLGCQVDLAANGEEAVKATSKNSYDLILMDCLMPLMNGFEASKKIRERERETPSAPRLPIVALTANTMDGDREKCLAAEMDDYIKKPFTQDQLQTLFTRWLPERYSQEQNRQKNKSQQEFSNHSNDCDGVQLNRLSSGFSSADSMDFSVLDKLRAASNGGSKNWLASVISSYLRLSPTLVLSLQKAVSCSNIERATFSAHGLKSSSANIGAVKLASLCEELEVMGRNNLIDEAAPVLDALMAEYRNVRETLISACGEKNVRIT